MYRQRLLIGFLILLGLLVFPGAAHADSGYDEGTDGDLSGDRAAPTTFALTTGVNRIQATSVQGDLEYVTVTLPRGGQLEQMIVASFVSSDTVAFAGIQQGATFTEPNSGADVANLLGYSHFGPGRSNVGTDILDEMGAGAGAIGFSTPLTGTTYTLWLQQTGVATTTYALDLVVGPGVSTMAYREGEDGDLSNDRLAPTTVPLVTGGNIISATSVRGDLEYVQVTVPNGQQLAAILVETYASSDEIAFAAIQRGTTFTEPPQGTTVGNLLGYSHFGPAIEAVGADLLDNMGAGDGAIGFSGALGSGDYTVWLQQTGVTSTTYALEFVIADVPTVTLYSEATGGDLSNEAAAPTALTAVAGGNVLRATSAQGDREYFSIVVPAGHQLDAIVVDAYQSTDERAFIAVQAGATFTEPPTGTEVGNLLGYSHFGPNVEPVGSNILDNIGTGAGAIGFTGSLPAGTYTFWAQQAGSAETTYELTFVVSPVPVDGGTTEQLFLPIIVRQ